MYNSILLNIWSCKHWTLWSTTEWVLSWMVAVLSCCCLSNGEEGADLSLYCTQQAYIHIIPLNQNGQQHPRLVWCLSEVYISSEYVLESIYFLIIKNILAQCKCQWAQSTLRNETDRSKTVERGSSGPWNCWKALTLFLFFKHCAFDSLCPLSWVLVGLGRAVTLHILFLWECRKLFFIKRMI